MNRPSAAAHRLGIGLLLAVLSLLGCASGKGDPKDGDKAQPGENTNEGFSSGGSQKGLEDVEPADHDIEVPPAP
jgi:hypothetical protein